MDLTVYNHRPEQAASCPGCRWNDDGWADGTDPPRHTCRSAPATPQCETQAANRHADEVIAEREQAIRQQRLAEIQRGWH